MKHSKKILSSVLIGTQLLNMLGGVPIEASVNNFLEATENTTTSEQETTVDSTSVNKPEVKNDTLSNGIQSKPENGETPLKNINSNHSMQYLSQSNISISQDDRIEKAIEEGTKHIKNKITESFIEKIGEYAREIALKNELYSSVMIATYVPINNHCYFQPLLVTVIGHINQIQNLV